MIQIKKERIKIKPSKLEKRDILTEMFEHFGIKVIDVNSQDLKPKPKRVEKLPVMPENSWIKN